MKNISLVITSISEPNKILKIYAEECHKRDIDFILIGDVSSPDDFYLENCKYYNIDDQKKLEFEIAKKLPFRHYSRKNIGYLLAMKNGTQIILETDDDNEPKDEFWDKKELEQEEKLIQNTKEKQVINIYKYFDREDVWPRGMPLENILKNIEVEEIKNDKRTCPIIQGLADNHPDVDSIYRFTNNKDVKIDKNDNYILGRDTWCPFNSQNTTWFKEAFPLMYLPVTCTFRMTDIWRSFIVQRILWTNDWYLMHTGATVTQYRNEHDNLKDFKDEVPGFIYNQKIIDILSDLDLKNGNEYISENLLKCYQVLVDNEIFEKEELVYVKAWLSDIEKLK